MLTEHIPHVELVAANSVAVVVAEAFFEARGEPRRLMVKLGMSQVLGDHEVRLAKKASHDLTAPAAWRGRFLLSGNRRLRLRLQWRLVVCGLLL